MLKILKLNAYIRMFKILCLCLYSNVIKLESNIRSKYFQKWKPKFCLILESLVGRKIPIENTSQNKKKKRYSNEFSFSMIKSGRSITVASDKIFAQTFFEYIDKG